MVTILGPLSIALRFRPAFIILISPDFSETRLRLPQVNTSQQINKFPSKRVKNLATPSSIFIFVFSPFTGELCSQPIRGNDRPIGRMFPEHVERRFLDPEYSFDEYFQLGSRRKVGPIKNQLASPNTSN